MFTSVEAVAEICYHVGKSEICRLLIPYVLVAHEIMVYSSVGRADNDRSPHCGIGESAVLTGAVQRERKDEGMKDNGRNSGKYIAFLLVGICVCALAACGMDSLRKGNTPRDNIQEGQESGSKVEAESSENMKEENISGEENAASVPEDSEDREQELSVLVVLWDGEKEDYEDKVVYGSREKFLEDFGFADKEPFYEYMDTDQQLVLELYFDEKTEQGCGLYHNYVHLYEAGDVVKHYGFVFQHVTTEGWIPEDNYSTLSVFGDDAKELELSQYQEIFEYADNGKLSSFEARGIIPDLGDEDIEDSILSMSYTYRDDGTLAYKEYHHHSMIFGTWMQSMRSWYDRMERLVYRSSYITHGSLENFYIYENDGDWPGYLLILDEHGGYAVWPEMIRFR